MSPIRTIGIVWDWESCRYLYLMHSFVHYKLLILLSISLLMSIVGQWWRVGGRFVLYIKIKGNAFLRYLYSFKIHITTTILLHYPT